MSPRHRNLIIVVVVVIGGTLLGFWLWAAPVMLQSQKTGSSFFSIFKSELGRVKEAGTALLPQLDAADNEQTEILAPAAIEKINNALDQQLAEPAPALPEAKDRKNK